MSASQLHIISPDLLADHLRQGPCRQSLEDLARLAGVDLIIADPEEAQPADLHRNSNRQIPVLYRGQKVGSVEPTGPPSEATDKVAHCMVNLLEHMLDREMAVSDLADALSTGYEELNLLYTLLSTIATKVDPAEIGRGLVAEAARTLGCRRVSLLVLDEKKEKYRVLASVGLPPDAIGSEMSVSGSVASKSLDLHDPLVVNHIADYPDLAALSKGQYDSNSFAVVRVPLKARGEALGMITVTERKDGSEFTARDHKLLQGLSAMGASALLNCRLHTEVNRQMLSTIHALVSAIDAKDHYTHDHAGRVSKLCVATARKLGVVDQAELREIELAGLMHDIGKIGIPDAILSKPGNLTAAERAKVTEHAEIGAAIVGHIPGLERVALAIRHHHERHDGLGYPSELRGDEVPLASSLIAVADTYDALTTDRPYRKGCDPQSAIDEIRRCQGTQLNPEAVDALVEIVSGQLENIDPVARPMATVGL
ncbi:MAG: HD domain-containing phosphohydrolase [Phycisphaerae bacterium]